MRCAAEQRAAEMPAMLLHGAKTTCPNRDGGTGVPLLRRLINVRLARASLRELGMVAAYGAPALACDQQDDAGHTKADERIKDRDASGDG
jgi:hypothetical protein